MSIKSKVPKGEVWVFLGTFLILVMITTPLLLSMPPETGGWVVVLTAAFEFGGAIVARELYKRRVSRKALSAKQAKE